ncbi:MAG TPA: arsenate reductase ArsC, partial [Erythrobacter sp.]|nr:arsenate reductase ArsC [Erythrobacter sp.]
CPVFLGSPLKAHWGLPDPADVTGTDAQVDAAFEETWRLLEMRVRAFLALDRAALDKAALQSALAEIGAMEGAA